ncbi:MAG: glutamate racemase [Candidatus Paceibacterota bacterium]|jgi:glutamate racemase
MVINIGVFDSGVGGLWILKYLREKLPEYNYIFLGDQAHVPYGSRSQQEIQIFSEEISKFLISKDCQLIVVACNTASGASLKYLREKFPQIPFVGMEPAIKPAVEVTETGKVGVLATPATFEGELYNSVVERFSHGVELFQNTCSGLVEEIEKGELDSKETKNILEKALRPMLEKGIDTVVLGCTHYPFVIPVIKEIVGEKIKVIDPTPAITRQVGKILDDIELDEIEQGELDLADELSEDEIKKGITEIYTSGDKEKMELLLPELLGEGINVKKIDWENDLKLLY